MKTKVVIGLSACCLLFLLGSLLFPNLSQAQMVESRDYVLQPLKPSVNNLLGNGGFEVWNLGYIFEGSIPPDLWYPMGETMGLFTQANIAYSRIPAGSVVGFSGEFAVNIIGSYPGTYVSQTVENYSEFLGKELTFSVNLAASTGNKQATIEIHDGVTFSPKTGSFGQATAGRLTVQHTVDPGATKIEVRIYPDEWNIIADNAQLILGSGGNAKYVPRRNPEPALTQVPLGTVLDWWRFNQEIPVPEGFAICDGSSLIDVESPFTGMATPDLSNQFIRGVVSPSLIGSMGGNSQITLDLQHDHSMGHQHDLSNHTHSGTTEDEIEPGKTNIGHSVNCADNDHHHPFTTEGPSVDLTGDSTASQTGQALSGTVIDLSPEYVGLLKIIRIK